MSKEEITINQYNEKAKPLGRLQRFQWVVDDILARCSQPGYYEHGSGDMPHFFENSEVLDLKERGINLIISANSCAISDQNLTLLKKSGIGFHHFPVADFTSPTRDQIIQVAHLIEANPSTLVYCGYGQGRTGTLIASWAILSKRFTDTVEFEKLKKIFGIENLAQFDAVAELIRQK